MMRVHDVQTTCCFLPFFYSPTYDFKALRLRASGRNNPNIVAPTMLGIVACMLTVVCKRMQQLPTMLRQQCWELLRACWQWCTNGCNNSQQCWDLQCIMGRIQPISLCKPCVMSVRGPNNVGWAVQTNPTLLHYASAKWNAGSCWVKSLAGFKLCAITRNNMQQCVQTDATCNIQQCWKLLANNVASVCTGLKTPIMYFE